MLTSSDQTFYSTAAQVIPLMAVGLAVEARVFDRLPPPKHKFGWWIVYTLIGTVVGLMLLAEVVALSDLETGDFRSNDKSAVACGLVAGGLALYFGLMPRLIRPRGPWDSRIGPLRVATVAVPIVVVACFITRS